MIQGAVIGNIAVDSRDATALRDFYAGLLGAEACVKWGCPAVLFGGWTIIFMQDSDFEYVPPVWPEEPGRPQKQLHFDFQADDLGAAVAEAERLGAKKADKQYGGEHWVTMVDPDGHPFCICAKEPTA